MMTKALLTFWALFSVVLPTYSQGRVSLANNCGVGLSGAVYGVDPANPYVQLNVRDAAAFAGRTLLDGASYTAELWWSADPNSDEKSLTAAPNAQAQSFRHGHFGISLVNIPNSYGGDHVTLQVRFWDNRSGTIGSWDAVLADNTVPRATSGLIHGAELSGLDAQGNPHLGENFGCTPELLSYIGLYTVPEPNIALFLGFAIACGFFLGFPKRKYGVGART